jgi:hypothetical protein
MDRRLLPLPGSANALFKLDRFEECIDDCTRALDADACWSKARCEGIIVITSAHTLPSGQGGWLPHQSMQDPCRYDLALTKLQNNILLSPL